MFSFIYNTFTVFCRCFIILASVFRFMIHLKSIFVLHVWRGRNLFLFYSLFSCFNTPLAEKIFLFPLNYFAVCQKWFDCSYVELFLESLLSRRSIHWSYAHTTNLIMIALQYVLKSGNINPRILFLFFSNVCSVLIFYISI